MLTIKKRSYGGAILAIFFVAGLSGCGPPGPRDLRKGERLIDKGQFADAIPVLSEAVELLKGSPNIVQATAWNFLGLACHGAGQVANATHAYTQALALDRNLWTADYNLGCLQLEQTNYPAAIDCLTTFTTSHPKDVNAFLLLGRAHLYLAMERTGAERSRQLEASKQDFEYAEKLDPTAEGANALGIIALQPRYPKAAIALFRVALQRDPHYAPALLNLAIVLQRYANDPKEALDQYRQYLALQPPPPQAGEVEKIAHQLDLDARITLAPRAPERPPTLTLAPTNTNVFRPMPPSVEISQPKLAPPPAVKAAPVEKPIVIQQPAPAVVVKPTPTPTLSTPAPIKYPPAPAPAPLPQPDTVASSDPQPQPVDEKKPGRGRKLNLFHWFSGKSKRADDSAPDSGDGSTTEHYSYPLGVTPIPGDRKLSEYLVEQGHLAEHRGDRSEAIRSFQEAIRADPTSFEAGLALGLAEIDSKGYPAALDALGQALTVQPSSPDARYAFAWVLGKQGYYQDAANELNKLIKAHPREVRAYLLLGNFYADNLGQPKLARDQYLRALEIIDPHAEQATAIRTWLDQHP